MRSGFASESKLLEEVQELNLKNNWRDRKDIARKIGGDTTHDIYQCDLTRGKIVFYIVRKDTPVGYILTYEDAQKDLFINTTYIVPIAQRQGLGMLAYTTIIRAFGKLSSDITLSDGARALWSKLQTNPEFSVTQNMFDGYTAVLSKSDIN